MRFRQGCTRLVILTETMAIKVALPFRPFLPLFIFFRELLKGELRGKLRRYRGNLIRLAVWSATVGGIVANRREMRISREHPEYPIAPVLRSYLWGFIIVMGRGEPAGDVPDSKWRVGFLPARLRESDMFYPTNWGIFGNKLLFVDYGDPSADEILAALATNHP